MVHILRRPLVLLITLMFSVMLSSLFFILSSRTFHPMRCTFITDDTLPNDIRAGPTCVDRFGRWLKRTEDVFCINLPAFLPHLKNPCFYDPERNSKRVLKCLPYFYIIGMDKSGTTDLHSRIAAHPDVRNNSGDMGKETFFWSWSRYGVFNYKSGLRKMYLQNYFNLFANTAKELKNSTVYNEVITGDATPMDMWDFRQWRSIPQNFGKLEPEVLTPHLIKHVYNSRSLPKMLIQLREPVERLYSDYIFLNHGNNPSTFHSHVLKAISIITNCIKTRSRRQCYFDKNIYRQLPTRIHLGCYSVFLKEWLQVFPMSSFHVTRTEDYKLNMKDTLQDIFSFLKLKPVTDSQLGRITSSDRKHVTMSKNGRIYPDTFSILRKFYRPCLEETASLLNDKRFLFEDIYESQLAEQKEYFKHGAHHVQQRQKSQIAGKIRQSMVRKGFHVINNKTLNFEQTDIYIPAKEKTENVIQIGHDDIEDRKTQNGSEKEVRIPKEQAENVENIEIMVKKNTS